MDIQNKKNLGLIMIVAAFFWGTTFVAQRSAAAYLGTFTWVSIRALLAVVMLIPCIVWMRKKGYSQKTRDPKKLWIAGLCCGGVLFLSTSAQQLGMHYTSASKAGFISALYIVIVPVLRMIGGKRTSIKIWACVLVATVGMYLMSVTESFTVEFGDLILLVCALFFSVHILVVDRFSGEVEALALCQLQFLVSGLLALPCAFLFETPELGSIMKAAMPIVYAALFSGCIAYSCQIIGQRYVEPAKASLMMCLESVFALLSGWLVLGERFTLREGIGSLLIFAAIVGSTLFTRNGDGMKQPVMTETVTDKTAVSSRE